MSRATEFSLFFGSFGRFFLVGIVFCLFGSNLLCLKKTSGTVFFIIPLFEVHKTEAKIKADA
jgi:hypothetical protein